MGKLLSLNKNIKANESLKYALYVDICMCIFTCDK